MQKWRRRMGMCDDKSGSFRKVSFFSKNAAEKFMEIQSSGKIIHIIWILKNKMESSQEAVRRAASIPLLLCHGRGFERIWLKKFKWSTLQSIEPVDEDVDICGDDSPISNHPRKASGSQNSSSSSSSSDSNSSSSGTVSGLDQSKYGVCNKPASLDPQDALEVGDGVFEVLSTSGDTHLGGDDFDKRIVDWLAASFKNDEGIDLLKDKQALQRLTKTTEKAKMELSSLTQTNISLPFITATAEGPKHIETTITRAKFEELCSDFLDRVVEFRFYWEEITL